MHRNLTIPCKLRQSIARNDMLRIQISILRDLIFNATKRGISFQQACKAIDVTPEQLNDAEGYISYEKSGQFWEYAVATCGDEHLGLHIGQEANLTFFGVLGYLLQNCKSVAEAYKSIVRFNDTVSSVFQYRYEESGDQVKLIFNVNPLYTLKYPEAARQAVELSISSFLTSMFLFTGKRITPLAVYLTCSKRTPGEYEKVLQTKVYFDSPSNQLVISKADFNLPIVKRDNSLYELFTSILLKKEITLNNQLSLKDRIMRIILTTFKGQVPPVDAIASQLAITTRTLQRKLAQEGTTYREITTQVVQDLSDEMSSLNIVKENISMLLGYADSSTLRRMSKKWSGRV